MGSGEILMNSKEYEILQECFSEKLQRNNRYRTKRESAMDQGILACKSILKEVYESGGQTMTAEEYKALQERLQRKLKNRQGKKEEAYDEGVMTCKTALNDFFRKKGG